MAHLGDLFAVVLNELNGVLWAGSHTFSASAAFFGNGFGAGHEESAPFSRGEEGKRGGRAVFCRFGLHEIGDQKRTDIVTDEGDARNIIGTKTAAYRFANDRHGLFKAENGFAHDIGGEGISAHDECADLSGGSRRGTVSLHADDGVGDGDDLFFLAKHLTEIADHTAEFLVFGEGRVHFKFFDAGNDTEKVFDGGAHFGESVTFQLTKIDDNVCLCDGADDVEGLDRFSLGEGNEDGIRIVIECDAVTLCHLSNAAGAVDSLQALTVIKTAGAFRNERRYALFLQNREKRRKHGGMRGGGGIGGFFHHEIGLDDDFFPLEKGIVITKACHLIAEDLRDPRFIVNVDGADGNDIL